MPCSRNWIIRLDRHTRSHAHFKVRCSKCDYAAYLSISIGKLKSLRSISKTSTSWRETLRELYEKVLVFSDLTGAQMTILKGYSTMSCRYLPSNSKAESPSTETP